MFYDPTCLQDLDDEFGLPIQSVDPDTFWDYDDGDDE
jgi:hypothetical protein